MKKNFLKNFLILICILFFKITNTHAETVSISHSPTIINQGDPVLVQITGLTKISDIKEITFDKKKLHAFTYRDKPSILIGVDLNKKPGNYIVKVSLKNKKVIKDTIAVTKRDIKTITLGIPTKLGGNTKKSQTKLVKSLDAEKILLNNIKTSTKALWIDNFAPPTKDVFVTDVYGTTRKTGKYSIPHKGTDYRAPVGTEILAINSGIVRINKSFRDYGQTIIIDHGMGVTSFYLHLSKSYVKTGDTVERGQVIGLSGETGYSEGPHLHLTIRINNIAIDPVAFFDLFK